MLARDDVPVELVARPPTRTAKRTSEPTKRKQRDAVRPLSEDALAHGRPPFRAARGAPDGTRGSPGRRGPRPRPGCAAPDGAVQPPAPRPRGRPRARPWPLRAMARSAVALVHQDPPSWLPTSAAWLARSTSSRTAKSAARRARSPPRARAPRASRRACPPRASTGTRRDARAGTCARTRAAPRRRPRPRRDSPSRSVVRSVRPGTSESSRSRISRTASPLPARRIARRTRVETCCTGCRGTSPRADDRAGVARAPRGSGADRRT
jgi:hypothetical protein